MPAPPIHRDADGRPDFMVVLGVAPPYAEEDVKQAYFTRAKELHPDHGGNATEFNALNEAFQQAQVYLEFRANSRGWIAKQMDGYLKSRQLVDQLEQLGATVETQMIDWLERSFGDFAELTDSIVAIRLVHSPNAEQVIDLMLANESALNRLVRLELPGCPVTDQMAYNLTTFQQLHHLDLSGTHITKKALEILDYLPVLHTLDVSNTNVGWWARKKLHKLLVSRRAGLPEVLDWLQHQ